ncbi:MAG: hypothetical protein ABJZ55_10945 [Fuerstiella sp.]
MVIRNGNEQDLPRVMDIIASLGTHFIPESHAYIADDFLNLNSLVYETNCVVHGFIVWISHSVEIELLWLAIDPMEGRNGVGSCLVEAVLETATTQRMVIAKTATIDSQFPEPSVSGLHFQGTIRFFEKLGFHQCAIVSDFWAIGNHCQMLLKRLDERH